MCAARQLSFPEHVREEVVRIGREALLNAFRHAAASVVRLNILQSPECLEVEVTDDGRGLPESAAAIADTPVHAGHWGLIGMRERAILIAARLTISSEKDQGTHVRLVVPYQARAGAPGSDHSRTSASVHWQGDTCLE